MVQEVLSISLVFSAEFPACAETLKGVFVVVKGTSSLRDKKWHMWST